MTAAAPPAHKLRDLSMAQVHDTQIPAGLIPAGAVGFRIPLPAWFDQRTDRGEKYGRWVSVKGRREWRPEQWRPVWGPLNLNECRKPPASHWTKRDAATSTVRAELERRAGPRQLALPPGDHLVVRLHYRPSRNGTRDGSNLQPLQKAAVDGLARGPQEYRTVTRKVGGRKVEQRVRIVGLTLVPDDTAEWVTELPPAIVPVREDRAPALWLDVFVVAPRWAEVPA